MKIVSFEIPEHRLEELLIRPDLTPRSGELARLAKSDVMAAVSEIQHFFDENPDVDLTRTALYGLMAWIKPRDNIPNRYPNDFSELGGRNGVSIGLWGAAELYQGKPTAIEVMSACVDHLNAEIGQYRSSRGPLETRNLKGCALYDLGQRGLKLFDVLTADLRVVADKIHSNATARAGFMLGCGVGLLVAAEGYYAREMTEMFADVDMMEVASDADWDNALRALNNQ